MTLTLNVAPEGSRGLQRAPEGRHALAAASKTLESKVLLPG